MGVDVVDLRGQARNPGGYTVLADPTGRRRRYLIRVGRVLGCVLGAWLCGLAVAGFGLLPAPLRPFVPLAGSTSSLPRLERLEHPSGSPITPAPDSSLTAGRSGAAHAARPFGHFAGAQDGHAKGSRRQGSATHGGAPARLLGRTRAAPGGTQGAPGRSTVQVRPTVGVQSGASARPGAAKSSEASGRSPVTERSRGKSSEARGQLPSGSRPTTSGTQASTSSSSTPARPASATEHSEVRGREKATLTGL